MCTKFHSKDLKRKDHLGDPGINGRIMLNCTALDWIQLAQDSVQRCNFMNMVMKLRVA
jgi:hypothetical protein